MSSLILSASALNLGAQTRLADFRFQSPSLIEMKSGGDSEFKIDIMIPEKHHIYVQHANSLSFNVLTEFSIDEKSGFSLETSKIPSSIKKGNDMILNGKGRGRVAGSYSLLLSEIEGRKKSQKVHTVAVNIKTQLCDTEKDICFAPQDFRRTLRIRITEDKSTLRSRSLKTDNINWLTDDKEAMRLARERGQNIYVLFTASWCGPCVRFNENVLSKQSTSEFINKNFIALKFEHGSADSGYFQKYGVRAFPTTYVADSGMKVLNRAPSRASADSFRNSIASYARPFQESTTTTVTQDITPEVVRDPIHNPVIAPTQVMNLEILGGDSGELVLTSSGRWEFHENNFVKYRLQENRRDDNYIIMLNQNTNEWLAVPIQGKGNVLVYRNDEWTTYGIVR